jgi:hypothetical protein
MADDRDARIAQLEAELRQRDELHGAEVAALHQREAVLVGHAADS